MRCLLINQLSYDDRLKSFVGRARNWLRYSDSDSEKLQAGGYVTITGQAGQGKVASLPNW